MGCRLPPDSRLTSGMGRGAGCGLELSVKELALLLVRMVCHLRVEPW